MVDVVGPIDPGATFGLVVFDYFVFDLTVDDSMPLLSTFELVMPSGRLLTLGRLCSSLEHTICFARMYTRVG